MAQGTRQRPTDAEHEAEVAALDETFGGDLARQESRQFNVVSVRKISGDLTSFDSAVAAMSDAGISVDTASPELIAELTSDGFVRIDKSTLINRKCLFIAWTMDSGSRRLSEDGFLIVRAVTSDNERVWFTCGGYGLAEELRALTAKRVEDGSTTPNAGLMLPKGLDRSAPTDYPDSYIYRIAV